MKYDSSSLVQAPKLPGIYKILYKRGDRTYIGATRNLRNRFKQHKTQWYSQQWKIDLCKELLQDTNLSLKEIYPEVSCLFEYEIIELFESTISTEVIKQAEIKYVSLYKPCLNSGSPNYSERFKSKS